MVCSIQLNAQSNTDNVKIFPNPATEVINILGLNNTPNAYISITDSYGNQVIHH